MKNPSTTEGVENWTTNQVVLATLFVVSVFLTFLLLYRLRTVFFLFFVAIVIGTAIRPAVDWLYRRGISRPVGIIAIYLLLGGCTMGFLALFVPLIADQGTQLIQYLPQYYENAREGMLESQSRLLQNFGLRLPAHLGMFPSEEPTTEEMFSQVNQTLRYTNLVLRGILSTFAIFLLAFYWTQESPQAIRTLLQFVPPERRKGIREFIYLAEQKIGGYMRGQGILSLAVGFAAFVAYFLIGLPFALVLAIIAGILEMVPVLGPALGAFPAILVALSVEPSKAFWVLLATAVIQMMEGVWLMPRIMNHSMGVNSILILLSLIAFTSVLGLPGAILAIPLAAMIQLILDRIVLSSERLNGVASNEPLLEDETKSLFPLLDASQFWTENAPKNSHSDGLFPGLTEADRQELYALMEALNTLINEIKPEEARV